MQLHAPGCIAVIFCSARTGADETGYAVAAQQMVDLAAQQSGYLGYDTAHDSEGVGITVSYWEDYAAAKAWRDHPEHSAIRDAGRGKWYQSYTLHVARVERSYDWQK